MDDTIADIKYKYLLAEQIHCKFSELILYHGGMRLKDDKTVSDHKLTRETTIVAMFLLRGD